MSSNVISAYKQNTIKMSRDAETWGDYNKGIQTQIKGEVMSYESDLKNQ